MYRDNRVVELSTIALKYLSLKTLRSTGNDDRDTRTFLLYQIKDALTEAYKAGLKDGRNNEARRN